MLIFKKQTPENIRARLNTLEYIKEINLEFQNRTKDKKELIKIEERLREIKSEQHTLK